MDLMILLQSLIARVSAHELPEKIAGDLFPLDLTERLSLVESLRALAATNAPAEIVAFLAEEAAYIEAKISGTLPDPLPEQIFALVKKYLRATNSAEFKTRLAQFLRYRSQGIKEILQKDTELSSSDRELLQNYYSHLVSEQQPNSMDQSLSPINAFDAFKKSVVQHEAHIAELTKSAAQEREALVALMIERLSYERSFQNESSHMTEATNESMMREKWIVEWLTKENIAIPERPVMAAPKAPEPIVIETPVVMQSPVMDYAPHPKVEVKNDPLAFLSESNIAAPLSPSPTFNVPPAASPIPEIPKPVEFAPVTPVAPAAPLAPEFAMPATAPESDFVMPTFDAPTETTVTQQSNPVMQATEQFSTQESFAPAPEIMSSPIAAPEPIVAPTPAAETFTMPEPVMAAAAPAPKQNATAVILDILAGMRRDQELGIKDYEYALMVPAYALLNVPRTEIMDGFLKLYDGLKMFVEETGHQPSQTESMQEYLGRNGLLS